MSNNNLTIPVSSAVSVMEFRGGWDASGGNYPATPLRGDYHVITVAGTIDSKAMAVGDAIVFNGMGWILLPKTNNAEEVGISSAYYTSTDLKKALEEIAGLNRSTETVKDNADAIAVLYGDDATDNSVLKTVKVQAEKADFTDTSGLESITLADAINEIYAEKDSPEGLASLDVDGKVPTTQLPLSVMSFKGLWDASTEAFPTDPVADDYYVVAVAGTIGLVSLEVGDSMVFNGTDWILVRRVAATAADVALTSDEFTALNVKDALEETVGIHDAHVIDPYPHTFEFEGVVYKYGVTLVEGVPTIVHEAVV